MNGQLYRKLPESNSIREKVLVKLLLSVIMMGMLAMLLSCADPPTVIQGTVVSLDEAGYTITIQDELDPDNICEFSYEGADVGVKPQPGDTVRIAYRDNDGRLAATRIMNISRQ